MSLTFFVVTGTNPEYIQKLNDIDQAAKKAIDLISMFQLPLPVHSLLSVPQCISNAIIHLTIVLFSFSPLLFSSQTLPELRHKYHVSLTLFMESASLLTHRYCLW
jgi:hypothetical protein